MLGAHTVLGGRVSFADPLVSLALLEILALPIMGHARSLGLELLVLSALLVLRTYPIVRQSVRFADPLVSLTVRQRRTFPVVRLLRI